MQTDPPPVQQHGLAVLLQGLGVSEVYALVEAGLQWMKGQGIKAEQMARLRGYRDVLAAAHTDRMFAKEHELPVYVVAEQHSICQDVADLMTVADAAEELGYSVQHVRRLARSGLLQREGISGLIYRSSATCGLERPCPARGAEPARPLVRERPTTFALSSPQSHYPQCADANAHTRGEATA